MRTFIIRARKGTTHWDQIRSNVGSKNHFEVIAHSIMNAFFISNDFRRDVEVYIVLDSSEDFPRTIKLSSNEGLSIEGFHEEAIITLLENSLKNCTGLQKDETRRIMPGIQISGFGFEKLVNQLIETRPIYLLEPKGNDMRTSEIANDPVFILSDHIAMPKNNVKSLKRRGATTLSLCKTMLFAAQCITIIHYELDQR